MKPSEYDVNIEAEFNREKLRTTIPKRLQELLEIIDARRDRLEDWYASLFIKMLMSVARVCHDLLQTTEREALPAAAWNARNLLELWIWIEYCSVSRDNARGFHEDALRDVLGLTDSISKIYELTGVRNDFDAPARKTISDVALEELGLKSLDQSYETVRKAAVCVGMDHWYLICNAYLSKFTHPTAGLVLDIMQESEKLRDLQVVCTTHGVYFAGQCVIALEHVILAIPCS
jgi:hypothetical protein